MLCNKSLHEIHGPNDRGAGGECAECIRDRGRKHAADRKEALTLARALIARGIPLDADLITAAYRLANG